VRDEEGGNMSESWEDKWAGVAGGHIVLADPTGQIERECADKSMKQADIALTYALAIRDERFVAVDWKRANAAILKRWPRGLERVKKLAWSRFR
jgi:hypothetical protein